MAARENQGYLIAVIVLVLFNLGFGLAAYFGWTKAAEYADNSTAIEGKLKVEEAAREAHQIEAEIARAYVGDLGESIEEVEEKLRRLGQIANNSSFTDAQKTLLQNVVTRVDDFKVAYERDMKQFIAKADEQTQANTWSGVFRHLITVVSRKHNELSVKRQENAEEKARLENEKNALQQRLDVSQSELVKRTEELKTAKANFQETSADLMDKLAAAKQTFDQYQSKTSSQISKLESENGQLVSTNTELAGQVEQLQKIRRKLETENFDIPDGQIVRVSPRTKTVYLDIGRFDGLRTNQTFAVYDKSVSNFVKGEQKARIEVTHVTGPKSADAKITEQSLTNPITRGDIIVTPTWDPGQRNEIAIAGLIDLDGDGFSDLPQFVRLIENSGGGKVIAQHDIDGKITGSIDANTRYFIRGENPKSAVNVSDGFFTAFRELEKQAEDLGTEVITVRQMLNRMGRHLVPIYRGNPKVDRGFIDSGNRNEGSGSSTR